MQQLQIPPLTEGEIYVGAIGDKNGDFHHVILLPGDNAAAPWKDQLEWAKSIGGDLPTRVEQALMFANCRDSFEHDWYWSNEPDGDRWAWFQHFYYGDQGSTQQDYELRARAVRRLPI
ncbi:DUF1566 domain-containing protein [Burkholderia vietnamiensis]|uniref:DUF1566 domain-containing protein n=1 Tax=Burkholderia vietnamiensis TaxID=60552 RepID=UPI001B921F36|nr:DUF1566 domain-containing protein [Burkholderia vietnamiensis]MBR7999209.1 DUF1566 domain-containing protein [Burkholderia vietnamiensis]